MTFTYLMLKIKRLILYIEVYYKNENLLVNLSL